MNRNNILYTIFLLITLIIVDQPCSAQEFLSQEREKEIKITGKYYWGEASNVNESVARKNAIEDLTNEIISDKALLWEKQDVKKTLEMKVQLSQLEQLGRVRMIAWIAKDDLIITKPIDQTRPEIEFVFHETAPDHIRKVMQNNTKTVFEEINQAYTERRNPTFSTLNITPEAAERVEALWKSSSFYCFSTRIERNVVERRTNSEEWTVRDVPVLFVEGDTDDDKKQNLVVEYTSEGKINDLYIAASHHDIINILAHSGEITDLRNRQMILEFVENFRTSYNRKDIDFLNKVFSDDALIITGKVLKTQQRVDIPQPINGIKIKYIKQSKKDYLAGLSRVFRNNSYINIKFDNIKVQRHRKNEHIYGVTVRQKWNSSSYSDEGWVFLIIDFKDKDNPLIWVRTWQELKMIEGLDEEIFGLDDFIIRQSTN